VGNMELLKWNSVSITEDTIKQFKCYLNKEECTGMCRTRGLEEHYKKEYIYSVL
jgi:hypothetical protein